MVAGLAQVLSVKPLAMRILAAVALVELPTSKDRCPQACNQLYTAGTFGSTATVLVSVEKRVALSQQTICFLQRLLPSAAK